VKQATEKNFDFLTEDVPTYLQHTLPWNLSDKKGNKNFSRKISDKKTAFFSLSQLF
jgi:hypothetical protein